MDDKSFSRILITLVHPVYIEHPDITGRNACRKVESFYMEIIDAKPFLAILKSSSTDFIRLVSEKYGPVMVSKRNIAGVQEITDG